MYWRNEHLFLRAKLTVKVHRCRIQYGLSVHGRATFDLSWLLIKYLGPYLQGNKASKRLLGRVAVCSRHNTPFHGNESILLHIVRISSFVPRWIAVFEAGGWGGGGQTGVFAPSKRRNCDVIVLGRCVWTTQGFCLLALKSWYTVHMGLHSARLILYEGHA